MADDYHTVERSRVQVEEERGNGESAAYTRAPTKPLYALDWGSGIIAGFVATVVITMIMYGVPPLMAMPPMDIATILGTMLLPHGDTTAFWIGMAWHFVNGIVFTLIYAGVLLAWRRQSGVGTGVVFGVVLWLIAMLMMPVMMRMHPLVQAGHMEDPGVFLLGMGKGWMPALFDLVAHVIYGAIAGAIYTHRPRKPQDYDTLVRA